MPAAQAAMVWIEFDEAQLPHIAAFELEEGPV
jgi:hypothetical protein